MAERRMNLASLVTGLLSLSVAGCYLLYRTNTIAVDEYVVLAGTVVALGLGGVGASVYGLLGRRSVRPPGDEAD